MPAVKSRAKPVLEVDFDLDITELYSSITSEDWDVAHSAVRAAPKEARTWVVRYEDARKTTVQWRFLPLHSACARQPPGDLVRALIKANPEGAACEDDQGMWPLHYACGNQASSDVVKLLLKSYPEAAKMPDPNGMLPLHYLTKWGPSEAKIVDMILSVHPDAVNAVALEEGEDEEGRNVTPLDLAEEGDYDEADRDYVLDALTTHQQQPAEEAEAQPGKGSSSQEGSASTVSTHDRDPVPDDDTVKEKYQAPAQVPAPTVAPPVVRQSRLSSSRRSKTPAADLGNKTTIAKLVAQLESTRKELSAAKREVAELREDKRSHEAYVELCEDKLAKKDVECAEIVARKEAECADLVARKEKDAADAEAKREEAVAERNAAEEEARDEAERMEADFADIAARHDALLEKADDLSGHVIALTSSVASLRADRETVEAALAEREERVRAAAQRRQKKLRELIDYEVELAKMTEEEDEEGGIHAALERQREEMEAVASILEAVNAKEEIMSVSSSCA
mmetsp:Transcript_35183/g.105081  ORF Transcript_35183/g.105081 Transcript_35183/m.105081 type:complete len:511 (-) Transcript_35183:327-1859(-)